MDSLDPLLQYGPNDGGYAGALQLALITLGVFVGAWLLGAISALIRNSGTSAKDQRDERE